MASAAERARELPPGAELDALFFETCWGWRAGSNSPGRTVRDFWRTHIPGVKHYAEPPAVTTDAGDCEAWVMRWCEEQEIAVELHIGVDGKPYANVARRWFARGDTYKHALTRAAIAAAAIIGHIETEENNGKQ